jgi:ATP:ADP antiporter, AAA family
MKRLASWCGIGDDERQRTLRLFLAALLLIAGVTTIKTVRDAVFLSHFPVEQLSWVMLATALSAGLTMGLYNRTVGRLRRDRVLLSVYGVVCISLVAVGLELRGSQPAWLAWLLHLWSSLVTVLLVAELWLLANELFDAVAARRVFAVVGAGAILGGVAGGASTRTLVGSIGTPALLWVAAAELAAACVFCLLAWKARVPQLEETAAPPGEDEPLRRNRYVRQLGGMLALMTIAVTLSGWQARSYVKLQLDSRQDELTAFFASVSLAIGIATFVVQLTLTSRILRRAGAVKTLSALPVACIAGALLLYATSRGALSGLWPAALAVVLVDGFEFSLHAAAVELLWAPLPPRLRQRAKRLIDTVVDRLAGAVAGILWLGLIALFHVDRLEGLTYASLVIVAVALVWMLGIQRVGVSYGQAYRELLLPDDDHPLAQLSRHARRRLARLLDELNGDSAGRTRILRKTARVLRGTPQAGLDWMAIAPYIARERELLVRLRRAQLAERDQKTHRSRALEQLLEEQRVRALERIARLLSLVYPPRDVLAIHRGLRGGTLRVRAAALLVLEQLLDGPGKDELMSALEEHALERVIELPPRVEMLRELMMVDEPRLRACAVWTAAKAGLLDDRLRRVALADPNARVRVAAVLAGRFPRRAPKKKELYA